MEIVSIRDGNLPTGASDLRIQIVKAFLDTNPGIWVQTNYSGIPAKVYQTQWEKGENKSFPSGDYTMSIVDGILYIKRYKE